MVSRHNAQLFTAEMRCARALARGTEGAPAMTSKMIAITARTPQIVVLFFMLVACGSFHRMVVTCLSRCQSGLFALTCPSADLDSGSCSL